MLYHHTDALHLPHILRTGALIPGRSTQGNYPDPDFLWATTDPRGDKGAAFASEKMNRDSYRNGETLHVRFTLDAADFVPWARVPELYPVWAAHADRLEAAGRRLGADPVTWWCRTELLPPERWLAVESRSYSNPAWRSVDCTQKLKVMVQTGVGAQPQLIDIDLLGGELPPDAVFGLAIQDAVYASARDVSPGQRTMIVGFKLPLEFRAEEHS